MRWAQFKMPGGEAYDLSHLDSFTMRIADEHDVLVTFGSHTFTREWKISDQAHLRFVDGSDVRCFCAERHGYSMRLPELVRSSNRAFFHEGRYMLYVDFPQGQVAPYAVFFNLERSRQKGLAATMFVVSAYMKPELPTMLPAVTMRTLVDAVSKGQKVKVPRDRRSIKRK
ncbi:MAG: hypothetical protein IT548_14465 [Alphaproteobacteria bacterium]|nr:hypothetical protein [Alphaproteobacteria bacterium]